MGDRLHHMHHRGIEDVTLSTVSGLLNRTTGADDLPLSAFAAAGIDVCGDNCEDIGRGEASLSNNFRLEWTVRLGCRRQGRPVRVDSRNSSRKLCIVERVVV